jgi:nucleotide-binding universal stress UspA family protein
MTETVERPKPFIVVGVDGSEPSQEALRWALGQAERIGAELRIFLACHVPPTSYSPGVPLPSMLEMEQHGREALEDIVADVVGRESRVTIRKEIVAGPPVPALLTASRDAELLVVGSRGHGGFVGMLLGSVSSHCVAHASCSVVVVRNRGTSS